MPTRRDLFRSAAALPLAALLQACGTTPNKIPPIPIDVNLPKPVTDFLTQINAIIADIEGSGAPSATTTLLTQLEDYVAKIQKNPPDLKAVVAAAATVVSDMSAFLPPPWNLAASAAAQLAKLWAAPPAASARMMAAAPPVMSSADATYVLTHSPAEGQRYLAARGIVAR